MTAPFAMAQPRRRTYGTVADAKEMEPLGRLGELREIFIPARVWSPTFDTKGAYSDEMFDFFANSQKLIKFEAGLTTLAYLRLGEPGIQRLSRLGQIKDLRICLVTIKSPKTLEPFVNMETLDLNDANVTDDMMPGLAGMKNLRRLTMIGTLITDEGLKYMPRTAATSGSRITRRKLSSSRNRPNRSASCCVSRRRKRFPSRRAAPVTVTSAAACRCAAASRFRSRA
jgi:hypothetical protein